MLSKLKNVSYTQSESYIKDKIKVILDLCVKLCYSKRLNDATFVDTSKLTCQKDCISLKGEINKLDLNKLRNTSSLKTKVDDLDVENLKTAPVDLKKLSDVVIKGFVKNAKFNKKNTKVNSSQRFNSHKLM